MNKRDFLTGVTVIGATLTLTNETQAATYVVPSGKKEAKLTWYGADGTVKYTTNIDVEPGDKFRIVSK